MLSRHCLVLIMAAGRSRRFGSDKRLARLGDGRTLLATTLAAARSAFAEVRVVVNAWEDPAHLGIPVRMALAIHPVTRVGLGGSIALAFRALSEHPPNGDIASAVIWLGDMPWVRPETCQRLARRADADTIVRPLYRGTPGHPVYFGRDFWPDLAINGEDQGARPLLIRYADRLITVPVEDSGVVRDIDDPQALPD